MKKIAIIDDKINIRYLKNKNIKIYEVIDSKIQNSGYEIYWYTHSTRIVQILEKYCNTKIDIINIVLKMEKNNQINILDVKTALNFCIDINVNIINLSIGSKRVSDIQYIYDEVQDLYEKGTLLVAASSNDFYMTIPASMPQVIGVVHDYDGILFPKEIKRLRNNLLGIGYLVNSQQLLSAENYIASNSFAAPYMIAKILEDNILLNQLQNSMIKIDERDDLNIERSYDSKPKVVLKGVHDSLNIMRTLINQKKVETIGVQIMADSIYLLSIMKILELQGKISEVINTIEKYIISDLILIFINSDIEYDFSYVDLRIEMEEKATIIKTNGKEIITDKIESDRLVDVIINFFDND